INLNNQEHIENLFKEARQTILLLDQSNQDSIIRTIEQYEIRWKDLQEHLTKKLEETEKIHHQTQNLIQNCNIHFKQCLNFISILNNIQNDSTQTS
ncbi:unnamed protein product, partial [Rotaria sp. Silwood1]